jgi:hypothetical protein
MTSANVIAVWMAKRLVQLIHVLAEGSRDVDESAVRAPQVLEVQRPFLSRLELRRENREDTAPDNRALDFRRRVDADDGGAVND